MSKDPLIREKALQNKSTVACVMVLCGYNYPFLWRLLSQLKQTAGACAMRLFPCVTVAWSESETHRAEDCRGGGVD